METGGAPKVLKDLERLADWDAERGKILVTGTAARAAVPFRSH